MWCDFGQLIGRSMPFLVLFGGLRWRCGVIFGGQWVFFGGAEEKEVPLTRPRIWKRAVNGAGRTDKKQRLTLRQRRSKNDNTQSPKEDTYFFRCKDMESFEVSFLLGVGGVVGTKNGGCGAYR